MKYYPIYLDISNKRCTVVGGGEVAERKVNRLLDAGASIVVVGMKLTPRLAALRDEGRIEHTAMSYRSNFLTGSFLVIGATDSDSVNQEIYRDAKEKGILVNIVDDPAHCDFILPSLFERGDLTIAVSTGGKSPALARKLRMELEKSYGPEYDVLIRIMGILREKVIAWGDSPEANRQIFDAVIESDILDLIRKKDWAGVKKLIWERTGETLDDFGGDA